MVVLWLPIMLEWTEKLGDPWETVLTALLALTNLGLVGVYGALVSERMPRLRSALRVFTSVFLRSTLMGGLAAATAGLITDFLG
jgi:predicted NBD/HSP70 family sugar kinase